MITDQQTNAVYFSSLIQSRSPRIWDDIEAVLNACKIDYHFIEGTRNIWCRDYMPIQIDEHTLVQFQYFPDYFLTPEHLKYITIQDETSYHSNMNVRKVPLIVDGGNVVKSLTKAILTEKVISDNKKRHSEKVTLEILRKALQVEEVFIIPKQPDDWSGHADGMLRFYDENTLLVNDFRQASPSWRKRMESALKKTGLKIEEFPYRHSERRNDDGEYTAHGCYINFAQIGNTILFPQFGNEFANFDAQALKRVKELYKGPDFNIYPIEVDLLPSEGGVLNCCTWNIRKPVIENAIDRILPVFGFSDMLLVILTDDYDQSLKTDSVCVKIHLDGRMYHEPWSLALHLKHGEVFQSIVTGPEVVQARNRISEVFNASEITEIYDKLRRPSAKAIGSLISIPQRLKSYR
jgi:agmatine deiminase